MKVLKVIFAVCFGLAALFALLGLLGTVFGLTFGVIGSLIGVVFGVLGKLIGVAFGLFGKLTGTAIKILFHPVTLVLVVLYLISRYNGRMA